MAPRTQRAAVRPEETREEPMREPVRATERTRKGTGVDKYKIDDAILAKLWSLGWDLQWNVDTVLGKPERQARQSMEVQGWTSVTGDMWHNLFDGMFMPKGYKGEIIVDGLVLQARPKELTLEARAEELRAARHARHVEESKMVNGTPDGIDPSFMDSKNPLAQKLTFLKKERIPSMPIQD